MKTHLKHLLGLALMVLVLVGCSNPAGPEIETPVVETPEENVKSVRVEFEWRILDEKISAYIPQYLLDLHFDSELNSYAYGIPEGYDFDSYSKLYNNTELFLDFFEDAFEQVFGTKEYKEGEVIDLKQWTSEAIRLNKEGKPSSFVDCLYFSTKDLCKTELLEAGEFFDEIIVGNEDILVYVFFDFD